MNANTLISIDVSNFISNFDISNAQFMQGMFKGCSSLTHLDLSHFNTSKVVNINEIFRNCYNLRFLNLSNWENYNINEMQMLFRDCHSLKEIDLSNFNTSLAEQINGMFMNCYSLISLDLSSFDTSLVYNMGHMFYGCKSLISLNITHFNTSNVKYFDNMFAGCSSLTSLDISNFLSKRILKLENMFEGCTNLSYINMSNFIEYNKTISIYSNLFNEVKDNLIICIHQNYTPIITGLVNEIGCATIYCGEDLLRINKKYNIYKNECITVCPEELPFEIISTQKCYNNCQINLILEKECKLNYEENNDNTNNKEIESTKSQDIMLRNVEISFTSDEYDTSNLDDGNEEIIKDDIMQITLTTTKKQKNNYITNNNKMTAINLGDCEDLLRTENKIPDEKLLYMRKIDVYQEGMQIPKVEFDVYYKENNNKLKKLNLTICENSNIYLSYPVNISENPDIYNPKSGYYNDICYPATSNRGTDITLTDRQKEFVEENRTLCQDGCELEKYDNINRNSRCSCKGKAFKSIINSISDIKIDKMKLFENFIDVNNIINIQIIKCYKILFSKEGIINNIAFYLIIPFIIFHIISIFIFYICQKRVIFDKIEDIRYAMKNRHFLIPNNKKKNTKIKNKMKTNNKNEFKIIHQNQKFPKIKNKLIMKNKKNIINNNIIHNNFFIKNNNINNSINNNIHNNRNINEINNNQNIEEDELKWIKLLSPFDYHYLNNIYNKKNQKANPLIKRKKITNEIRNNILKRQINNKVKETENTNRYMLNIENKEEIIEKLKKIMEYNDKEMNEFSYEQALKYDKRNYIQYYFSLLKTKYILIFSFYTSNDYNSKIIKIDLFFVGFVINYAINALFFNDDNIHKIYEDHGTFDILYQLPQIIYSYLISYLFDFLLNLLALSEDDIIEFKKIRKITNINKTVKELKNKLNIKFCLYFIISMLFLLFFWYYLSIFCAVYRNTQYHLLKDTLISFGLSLLTPLGFYLLPGIFRIPSLADKKNKKNYIFKFSQIIQIF